MEQTREDSPSLPEADEVQRVDVEAETEPAAGAAGGARGFAFHFGKYGTAGAFAPGAGGAQGKPPRAAAWICLVLAWLFLGSSLPFTVFLGVPLAIAAVVCGAACLSRGATATGVAVIALGSAGSFIVYLVGLFRFFLL